MYNLINTIPKNKKLILFDGVCNLCNDSVLHIVREDKKDIFLFTALQSKTGKNIINELGININKIDSIILYIPGGNYFIKSEAVFKIANEFKGAWKIKITIVIQRCNFYIFVHVIDRIPHSLIIGLDILQNHFLSNLSDPKKPFRHK
mgnify:CR=1 FL=1